VGGFAVLQRRSVLFAIVAFALTTPAYGQEVELAWKFPDKAKFFQTMKTTTTQTMKIMGQDVKQEQTQEFVFSWTVKEADAKKVVLDQKIESVNMSIKISSNEIKYNSTAKDASDNPLANFFRPLIGTTFTLTLDLATMKITEIKGREEFIKKLTDANPQMANLLKAILSEEQLKQMSEPAFAVVKGPGQKVKSGDSWTRESKLSMGPIGSYNTKYTYTYGTTEKKTVDGKEANLHKIDMKTELTYVPPEASAAAGLPFKIESGKLTAPKATGTIYFDAEKGRVVETKMEVELKGTLEISVAEQKASVDLEQKQVTTTLTSDKNPNEAAPAPGTPTK
jgi:uncharacterized protein DUF6263